MHRRDKIQRNIELIQRALEQHPDDLFHKFNLANTYFTAGEYEQTVYWSEQTCPYLRGDEDYAGHDGRTGLPRSIIWSGSRKRCR